MTTRGFGQIDCSSFLLEVVGNADGVFPPPSYPEPDNIAYMTPLNRRPILIDQVDLPRLSQIGEAIADLPTRRLSVGLVGTLGAGKTTLVKSLAAAMGIDAADVTSPTFTLHQVHHGRGGLRLHHLDAYRIDDVDAWDELGVDELHETDGHFTVIEWADLIAETMPEDTLWVHIALSSPTGRTVTLSAGPSAIDPDHAPKRLADAPEKPSSAPQTAADAIWRLIDPIRSEFQ